MNIYALDVVIVKTVEIDGLVCGNSLEILPTIPDNSIDLILTDPPYGTTKNAWDQFENFDEFSFTWLKECYRTSRGKYALVFWSQQRAMDFIPVVFRTGWKLKRMIIWYQPNAPIHNQDGLIFTWQPIFLLEKEHGSETINNGSSFLSNDVIRFPFPPTERYGHPTIKPLGLIRRLLEKYSIPGQVILDPFMGSGTVPLAAYMGRRHYIGIELWDKYYEMAVKRMDKAQRQVRL